MITIYRKPNESITDLLKRFNKKFKDSKLMLEYYNKMYYTKKSDIKRLTKKKAILKQTKIDTDV